MMKTDYKVLVSIAALLVATSCSQEYDLQGHDPQSYYAANPVKNKVENRETYFVLNFDEQSSKLSRQGYDTLIHGLYYINERSVNSRSIDSVKIKIPAQGKYKRQRVGYVKNIIRKSGIRKHIHVVKDNSIPADNMVVEVDHIAVTAPHCPDWRKSPVTTYSNMPASNFGCAATVNLGLMVADPHDLVHGKSSRRINTERSSKAISDYRSGAGASAASSGSSSSSDSSK